MPANASLVEWREQVAGENAGLIAIQEYWKPVPGFGDPQARILVVGLAPGAHGSNRTGRAFTGDGSGKFLYPSLYRAGLASHPDATSRGDGLTLTDVYIAAVARCAPPRTSQQEELDNCQPISALTPDPPAKVIVVLSGSFEDPGDILTPRTGFQIRARRNTGCPSLPADGPWLLASYHPSLQNTQTGRLTTEMFDSIWASAKILAGENEKQGREG
jgi:uracil-DNA glycosylase family 4